MTRRKRIERIDSAKQEMESLMNKICGESGAEKISCGYHTQQKQIET